MSKDSADYAATALRRGTSIPCKELSGRGASHTCMAGYITLGETEAPVADITPDDLEKMSGDIPDSFDIERFFRYEDRIHGEAFLPDGSCILIQQLEEGGWRADRIEDPDSRWSDEALWEGPGFSKRARFSELVRRGLSPAQALDYWMVKMEGKTASGWAEERDVTHQAVSENVREAEKQLKASGGEPI